MANEVATKGHVDGVLVDFGGVLTSSVKHAFAAASAALTGDPARLERALGEDAACARLLVEHECGRMSEAEFDLALASRLRLSGVEVRHAGNFVARIQAALEPDLAMLAAVEDLHRRGVAVAVVSNAFGDDCYRGYDLGRLARTVVASTEIGVRKPSREIYRVACERLGIAAERAVLVDDLAMNLAGAARIGIYGIHHQCTEDTLRVLDGLFPRDRAVSARGR